VAAYFIDNAGSDGASGLAGFPWQTKTAVNAHTFAPGDSLTFTAGQPFTGPFTFVNSGSAGSYISIGTGRGTTPARVAQSNPATISCANGNGIDLNDCEYVWLDNLIISGSGVNTSTGATTSTGKAVSVSSTQATNKLRGLRLTALTCTGTKDGIFGYTSTASQKGFDDLQVWGCLIHACQRTSIILLNFDGTFASGSATQNTNVYVGYCQVYDMPGLAGGTGVGCCGEGITLRNVTTATVEYSLARDINLVGDQGPGGTTGFSSAISNGVVVQYCEAGNIFAKQPTPTDGMGIDFESGANNCIAQYCYFHDCDGPGYLTMTSIAAPAAGNVVRFNVFARNCNTNNKHELWNTGQRTGGAGQTVSTTFYGNTVYATQGDAYLTENGGTDSLYNNILISKAASKCISGTPVALIGNVYFALGGGTTTVITYTSLAALRVAGFETGFGAFSDPLLNAPSGAPGAGTLPSANVSTLRYFDIPSNSPAVTAACAYATLGISPGSIDFRGRALTVAESGAIQHRVFASSGSGVPVF
jgi:hypothetical protein